MATLFISTQAVLLIIWLMISRTVITSTLKFKWVISSLLTTVNFLVLIHLINSSSVLVLTVGITMTIAFLFLIYNRLNQDVFLMIANIKVRVDDMINFGVCHESNVAGRGELLDLDNKISELNDSASTTLSFVAKLRDGIFLEDFESYNDQNKIHHSLRKLKDRILEFAGETNRIANDVSDDGKISARISIDKNRGQWKEMAEQINSLLESFSVPLRELNRIINSLAGGDLTERYNVEAKGEVLRMADNFNIALDNIDGLLKQVMVNTKTIDESSLEMKVASEEMTTNTSEIASALSEISNGSQIQVLKVDEASVLMEDVLNSSKSMVAVSELIHQAAETGVEHSEIGVSMVGKVRESMSEISKISTNTSEAIAILSNRSSEIERVLSVISDIAKQSNLLALNAAIEAAQAGEAGRGFAVVAEEIRSLADGSKKSTGEISELIQSVQQDVRKTVHMMKFMDKSVKSGVETSEQAYSSFDSIYQSSTETLNHSVQIVEQAKHQIAGINDVVKMTQEVVVIAEQTAAGSEQIAASASELSSGMHDYDLKSKGLAQIAESFKEGLSMVKISNDVRENTAIFKMKEAFEKEKYLLDALLNHMPDFIYFKDKESKFIRNSMAHIRRFGLDHQDQLSGKSDFDFHGSHAQKAYDDEQNIIITREPVINRVEKVDLKNGELKYLSTTKLPLLNIEGDVVGTFGISRDITESKMAELKAKDQAQIIAKREEELLENSKKMTQLEVELNELKLDKSLIAKSA